MSVQDDAREKNMVRMFNLTQDKNRKRHEPDAHLKFEGKTYQFELKSTTTRSLSTVRDFGKDHVEKWKEMHWIVGFYDKTETEDPKYCVYISPQEMSVWVNQIWEYVAPDYSIASIAPQRLELEDLYAVCHAKKRYLLNDAKRLHKSQYSKKQYLEKMDLPEAISRENFYTLVSPKLLPSLGDYVDTGKDTYDQNDLKAIVNAQCDTQFFQGAMDEKKTILPSSFSEIFPPPLIDEALESAKGKGITAKKASLITSKLLTQKRKSSVFDIEAGYSPNRMLNIFRDRAGYLIDRGSTLNNPHIPGEFFSQFEKITEDHASKLRKMLKSGSQTSSV